MFSVSVEADVVCVGVASPLSVSSNKTEHTETSIQDISGVSSINTIVYWVTVHLRFSIKAVFMFFRLDFSFVMHLLCALLLTERFFFIRLPPRQWATEWWRSCNSTKMGRPVTVLPTKSFPNTKTSPTRISQVYINLQQAVSNCETLTKSPVTLTLPQECKLHMNYKVKMWRVYETKINHARNFFLLLLWNCTTWHKRKKNKKVITWLHKYSQPLN